MKRFYKIIVGTRQSMVQLGALTDEVKQFIRHGAVAIQQPFGVSGADFVGADDLILQISKDEIDFDVLVATPDMMRSIARLGKKLGPRMPNAKSGTVGADLGEIVAQRKKGQIEYRNESKAPVVHSFIGKVSFESSALQQNCEALIDALRRAKPSSAKGTYFKSVTLSSTMGPGVKVDTTSI